MKKKSIMALAMAGGVLLAASCKKEQVASGPELSTTVEQMEMEDEAGAKTVYDYEHGVFYWKASDKLMIYDDQFKNIVYYDPDASYTYSGGQFSGSTHLGTIVPLPESSSLFYKSDLTPYTRTGGINESSTCYYAFYPSYYVERNGNNFEYTIRATQLLDNNTDVDKIDQLHLTRFPKAFRSSTTSPTAINMKNMCGGLKLKLQKDNRADGSEVKVKSIEFQALGNQQVTGKFIVTFDANGLPIMAGTGVNDMTRSITVEMNQPVSIHAQHLFYIPLPPATYNGFKIIITDDRNQVATLRSSGNLVINRSGIKSMTVGNATFSGTRAFKDAHGKFSISNSKQVYIAPGNLQWNNTNWQFASEQFEVMSLGCGAQYEPDGANADLFHFSLKHYNATGQQSNLDTTPMLDENGNQVNNSFGRDDANSNVYYPMLDYSNYSRSIGELCKYNNWGLAFGPSSKWYVLSKDEFRYLLENRINNNKCSCEINGTAASYCKIILVDEEGIEHAGLIIFPDKWENGYTNTSFNSEWNSSWTLNSMGTSWSNYTVREGVDYRMHMNTYRKLEEAGCAFLPATGYVEEKGDATRYNLGGTLVSGCIGRTNEPGAGVYNADCRYWTRDYVPYWIANDNSIVYTNAYMFYTQESGFSFDNQVSILYQAAVRLVMDCAQVSK